MNWIDWSVIAVYLVGLIAMGALLGKGQDDLEDYYLAGGKVKWWQSGLSTMATQLGAISFVSAPAFVAIEEGGGLKWLSYEFGVPLAMIVVMAVIIPALHRARVISIYEFLERRYDGGTRTLVSGLFQLGRGLGSAVTVYLGGIVISASMGVDVTTAILVLGVITIIYDMLGGMEGVILSDVIQMVFIVAGIVVCGAVAWSITGWEGAWDALSPDRRQIIDLDTFGTTSDGKFGFWPMLIGGSFLYMSYYGCDQSQVQRELSVGNIEGIRKSLILNALGRFPIVLLYCTMGVLIGAVIATPEFAARAGEISQPDRMVPIFILEYLPHGVIGFLFVAVMSALMSSLDSALNSLSAVTVQDFYKPFVRPGQDDRHYVKASKVVTALWGVFCVGTGLLFAQYSDPNSTAIELINALGSLLYGPILAVFLLGILTRRITPTGIKVGILAGVLGNCGLWILTDVAWVWWNATGFFGSVAVAWAVSTGDSSPAPELELELELEPSDEGTINWRLVYAAIVGYFFALVAFCYWLQS